MKAYSEDLRRKIVDAIERGMPKVEAARTFGVGISTVKRYVDKANKGESLSPRKPPGRKRKLDRGSLQLLADHLNGRAPVTLAQMRNRLEHYSKVRVSEATVSRAIKHLGWVREKDRWVRRR